MIELAFILVTQVLDGDTCKTADGTKIRMLGIDSPELKQRYGPESKAFLSRWILNKDVTLDGNKKDLYGRQLSYIMLKRTNINAKMIKTGNAWCYMVAKKSPLREMENKARAAKVGLWKDPQPLPPWDYRKQKK